MDSNQQDLVAQFVGITGANPASAQAGLQAASWNLQEAVQLYFAAQEEPQENDDDDEPVASASQPTAAQPSSSAAPPTQQPQRRKQMTLEDLKKMSSEGDGDEEDDKPQDMFAGGEKSGLAVQNPDQGGSQDHFKNIMRQAQQNRERPGAPGEGEQPEPPRQSAFSGRGTTLGGEGTESQTVEDPLERIRNMRAARQRERVTRTMHLWANGVSIDDGPLFRFDDPANEDMMREINQGRAPMRLLDVEPGQEVDLNLDPHKDEDYVQPKKQYKPFGGQGQRLGSPTPGPEPSSSTPATTSQPAAAPSTSSASNTEAAKQEVDESAPTLQLQIRLGDGTRLSSRFNTTHTIADVYAFVNRASAESNQRPYALMTTFPSKELEDKSQVLGEMGDFKRGGVVVQKWK